MIWALSSIVAIGLNAVYLAVRGWTWWVAASSLLLLVALAFLVRAALDVRAKSRS